jgi:outer membrane protein
MLRITEDELLAKQQLIQKLPTVYEEEMYEKQQLLMEPILKRLQTAVNEVAKEKGLNYIFDSGKGMLLYADTSDDITQDVKAKLGIK